MPTAEPYSKSEPTKQQENFFYVLQQVLAQQKTLRDGLSRDFTDLVDVLDMQSFVVDFGNFKVEVHGPKSASVLYR